MKNNSYTITKKIDKEKFAVIEFYRNQGKDIKEADLLSPDEDSPIDVVFNKDFFQVKCFPFESEEVEGRLRSGENNIISRQNKNAQGKFFKIKDLGLVPQMGLTMTSNEMKGGILEVINKAKIKCPRGIAITLLIHNRHISEDVLEKWIKDIIVPENNFKEIYVVSFRKNLRLK